MTTNTDASQAVMEFWAAHRTKFDGPDLDRFTSIASSVILAEKLGHMVEFVYAHMAKFTTAELEQLVPVASLVTELELGDMGENGRGNKILKLMKGQTVAVKDKPEPAGRFQPAGYKPDMPIAPGPPPVAQPITPPVVEPPQQPAAPK